jgi:hypothetical protein
MITGITVPANRRLQRTMMDKVPSHTRQRAAELAADAQR